MKYFNFLFDILLYEGLFLSFFTFFLLLVNDPISEVFFRISFGSLLLAAIFWIVGKSFNLFQKEDRYQEY